LFDLRGGRDRPPPKDDDDDDDTLPGEDGRGAVGGVKENVEEVAAVDIEETDGVDEGMIVEG